MKTRRAFLVVALLIPAAWFRVHAQESPSNTLPTASQPASADTNAVEPALRDPFWPIGYVKPEEKKDDDTRKKEEEDLLRRKKEEDARRAMNASWPKLDVSAISKTPKGTYIAMLKGIGLVEEGDMVKQRSDQFVYRWKITSINEKGISYKRLDAVPVDKK